MRRINLFLISLAFFTFSLETAAVEFPEAEVLMFSNLKADECVAAGKSAVYFFSLAEGGSITHRIEGAFILEPSPILSPDKNTLAVISDNGQIEPELVLINCQTREALRFSIPQHPTAWVWDPLFPRVICAVNGRLLRMNVQNGTTEEILSDIRRPIQSLTVSPSGRFLRIAQTIPEFSPIIAYQNTIFDMKNSSLRAEFPPGLDGESVWLDNRRLAVIAGKGEPDSFVTILKLDKEGVPLVPETVYRWIAQTGPSSEYFHLELSPAGNRLAVAEKVNSPVDFYGENAEYYTPWIPCFTSLDQRAAMKIYHHDSWPAFAWSPDGARYVWILHRIFAKPGYNMPPRLQGLKSDYAVIVHSETQPFYKIRNSLPKPIFISQAPVTQVCWNRDGNRIILALASESGTKIRILDVR
ncbi:MAG: hypothetical protein ACP5I1_09630 [Candidatus Hinthialibacter sp.]